MSNIKIAIVYFSKYGHTRLQAEAVRDGAASFKGSDVLLLDAAEAGEGDDRHAAILDCMNLIADQAVIYPLLHLQSATAFNRAKIDGGVAMGGDELYLLDRPQGEALYAARNRSRAEQAVEGFEAGSSVNPLTPVNEERIDPDDFRVTINAYKGYNIYVTNGVNYIVAKEGDTFESLAEIFCISARNLRKFNDLKGKAQPVRGEQIYIDRKQKRWEGNARHHIVTEGETVASVAQSYALREKSLRKLNRLKAGAALRTGQTLRIR